MVYNIQLSMQLDDGALQTLLRTLDSGPHGLMRGIIDTVISQAQQQAAEAKQSDTGSSAPPDETPQP